MGRTPKSNLPHELSEVLLRIGANLCDIRIKKGLSLTRLAELSKISLTTLNEIETKRYRDIRLSTLASLAKVLEIDVIRLFEKTDVKISPNDRSRLLKASEEILRITRKIKDED